MAGTLLQIFLKMSLPIWTLLMAASSTGLAAAELPAMNATRWVNSSALSSDKLRGKVVLIDVWEFTCVNWIRTSPYVKAWNRDYASLGLVVIGVHAPEFAFGKLPLHIDRGIRDHGLTYPVAIDNDFSIWTGLHNDAWPAKYLFDAQGRLVKRWIGEGDYHDVEATIRRTLLAANPAVKLPPTTPEVTAFLKTGMPSYRGITEETYIGADRGRTGAAKLSGDWKREGEYVELRKGSGRITLPFVAREVNLVAQPGASGKATFTVLLDGKPVANARGADVGADGIASFDRSGMLRLIAGAPHGRHELTLIASDPGTRAYVFTFGP
jgi:hypothetical protein